MDNHSSRTCVTASLKRPTRRRERTSLHRSAASLFGLAPGGVCRAGAVASAAVRSYRTVSPLPVCRGTLRRFTFCCTFRGLSSPRRYLAPCSPEPGLSSLLSIALKDSDCLAGSSEEIWCAHLEASQGPLLCESSALPLSYARENVEPPEGDDPSSSVYAPGTGFL